MTFLTIQDLTVSYQDLLALDQANLVLPQGVKAAILGPNGAGKSTLFKALLGLIPAKRGSMLLEGSPLTSKTIATKIAYIPQHHAVNKQYPATVLDIVVMGRHPHISNWRKKPGKQDFQKALEALEIMQLADLANRPINNLSGGQTQRVFIARAIAQEAEIYLLDEPLAGVDKVSENIIMDTLTTFQDQGKTSLTIHHDLNTVKDYFDYVVWVNKTVTGFGKTAEVFNQAQYEAAFGALNNQLFKELRQ